jgi:hypothetical protein
MHQRRGTGIAEHLKLAAQHAAKKKGPWSAMSGVGHADEVLE